MLEQEASALRTEIDSKDEEIASWERRYREAQDQIKDVKAELENNSVVFKMHYQEIITRNEEVRKGIRLALLTHMS